MPPRTYTGTSVASILARIRETLGPDAMVIEVRKVSTPAGPRYQALVGTEGETLREGSREAPRDVLPDRLRPAAPPAAARGAGKSASGRALRALGRAKEPRIEASAPCIALIGPTGAGKTTTIAKLASHPAAFGGRSVGLLCLDACRIGAVEQSRIFARLARLPLEIVAEPDELPAALHRLRHREVILVDTPGRGPLAREDRDATRRMLERIRPAEVHLLLPASVRASYARRAIAEHRPMGPTHLLPTKVDECPDDDWLFRLAAREALPIRWVAGGHRIPDDLYDARAGDLSTMAEDRRAPRSDPWGAAAEGLGGTA